MLRQVPSRLVYPTLLPERIQSPPSRQTLLNGAYRIFRETVRPARGFATQQRRDTGGKERYFFASPVINPDNSHFIIHECGYGGASSLAFWRQRLSAVSTSGSTNVGDSAQVAAESVR